MPTGLRRWQDEGHDHFITFSCHERRLYLASEEAKRVFLTHLETIRSKYNLQVFAYVLMPEHVHLLVSKPEHETLASALRVLKVQSSKALKGARKHLWEKRYHNFNVFSWDKRMEKIKYMHRNPVARGLVERPDEYVWSSFRHHLYSEPSPVSLDTSWLAGWQRQ